MNIRDVYIYRSVCVVRFICLNIYIYILFVRGIT